MIILQRLRLAIASIMLFNALPALSSEPHNLAPDHSNYSSADTELKNFDFDSIFFDEQDYDPFSNEFLDTVGNDHMNRGPSPEIIIEFLLGLGVLNILKEPLFLHTNELNKRSLLDQPIFEPDRPQFPGLWVVGASAFANKTNRSNFTKNSDRFDSYVALTQQSLLEKLANSVNKITDLAPALSVDAAQILGLFANMTIEQRQVGFMLHCTKKTHKTTFRILAPLYYLENNFSLTPKELDAVAEVFGESDPEEEKQFRKAHFINDKIGLGDTRIEIDQRILKRPSFTLRLGGLATIPTAWAWGEGFQGSSYSKPSTLPTLNLDPLFEAITNPNPTTEGIALESIGDFALDSFDRIAANLIDMPLGNNRHLGIGGYMRGKTSLSSMINTPFAERISFCNRISLELFLPSTEQRFYINKINQQELDNYNFSNDEEAAANLIFLEEKIVERLFLRAFNTRIRPGAIFRWSSQAEYTGKRFGFNLGSDFWLQDKAKFSTIHASPVALKQIDVAKAQQPIAYQSKIFGGLIFKHKTPQNCWFISLNTDASISNKGIGQDYTLSLNFEASF